ncbi:MAG TPA: glycosyltransferase family 2 protein [Steroidobacteraceae bacterium]
MSAQGEQAVAQNGGLIKRQDICAVVVTYFPQASSVENLPALSKQVGRLLIVDNGSGSSSFDLLEGTAQPPETVILRLGSNLGIAAALNVGLRFAHEHGYRWLGTFDQDSRTTPGMLEEMACALASYPRPEEVAVITPCHVDQRLNFTVRERACEAAGDGWRTIRSAMTSGNLVRVAAALSIGGFDESLFIDLVDHDFCLRLRGHGYRVLEATRARLLHSLGSMERRLLAFKRVNVTHHPAIRRYYMSRNRIILWRRHWRQEPAWVLRDLRRFLSESLCIVLYERQTGGKLRMIIRGIGDAIRHRCGPFREGG